MKAAFSSRVLTTTAVALAPTQQQPKQRDDADNIKGLNSNLFALKAKEHLSKGKSSIWLEAAFIYWSSVVSTVAPKTNVTPATCFFGSLPGETFWLGSPIIFSLVSSCG